MRVARVCPTDWERGGCDFKDRKRRFRPAEGRHPPAVRMVARGRRAAVLPKLSGWMASVHPRLIVAELGVSSRAAATLAVAAAASRSGAGAFRRRWRSGEFNWTGGAKAHGRSGKFSREYGKARNRRAEITKGSVRATPMCGTRIRGTRKSGRPEERPRVKITEKRSGEPHLRER